MSRVGRKEIDIPSSVDVKVENGKVLCSAKGATLEHTIPFGFSVEIKDKKIKVGRPSDTRTDRALHGTTRSLLQNMIIGLTDGFEKKLQIQGVGYKVKLQGKTLVLDIGFSHSIEFTPPADVILETPGPTDIIIKGNDKQKVGAVAAEIRDFYPPEPYKGKGIRYVDEYVRQKQGKSVA